MDQHEILLFFTYQREIFGICPCCGQFFRLSDCKIYKDERKRSDWLARMQREDRKLDLLEEKVNEDLEFYKEQAREKGRKEASRLTRKVDHIFTPMKLNADDAKVIFHPVDFVVFNGMKAAANGEGLKNILLLDGEKRSTEAKQIQQSLRKAVEKEQYEWLTLRVNDDGTIQEE